MSDPVDAKVRLGAALTDLWERAHKPTLTSLVTDAAKQNVKLSTSSLSQWFKGETVPSDTQQFGTLVLILSGAPPSADLKRLRQQAREVSQSRQGLAGGSVATAAQPGKTPAPGGVPRIDILHYANVPRLNTLLANHGIPSGMSNIPTHGQRNIITLAAAVESVVTRMRDVELPVRRFTQDLNLRSLRNGQLLVFDRRVFTLNCPDPGATPTLTGDLNVDPLVYIKKQGVRIVMPYDPAFITTSTAYSEFNAGNTQMVGLCAIKRRGKPTDAPHRNKNPKVQYVATPLLLGLSSEVTDLSEKVVHEDRYGRWHGPWRNDRKSRRTG